MAVNKRYSDSELEEFKAIILSRLEKAMHDYEVLRNDALDLSGNNTDDTSTTFKVLEDSASSFAKETAMRMAGRQLTLINNLKAALVRIENKTYGIDKVTGDLIPKERLKAVPHATMNVDTKQSNRAK